MASGITDVGKRWILEVAFAQTMNNTAADTHDNTMRVALVTNTPSADTTLWSEMTEISAVNGYDAGGQAITRNATFFPDSEPDTDTESGSIAYGFIQLKDLSWLADGGSIGSPTYAVLVDNENDGVHANNNVIAWWDLGGARSVSNGQTLTLQDLEIRLT